MSAFYGGVPRLIVPDNLPACRSEAPKVGLGMSDLLLARRLQHRHPNCPRGPERSGDAQRKCVGLGVSRNDLFEAIERPALRPLPAEDYEFAVRPLLQARSAEGRARLAESSKLRACRRGYVEIEKFFYSLPHGLIRAQVDVRMISQIVEVFHTDRRVAGHQRRSPRGALAPRPKGLIGTASQRHTNGNEKKFAELPTKFAQIGIRKIWLQSDWVIGAKGVA